MRDQSPSELVPGVAAHSLQRLVSRRHMTTIQAITLYTVIEALLNQFDIDNSNANQSKNNVRKEK